MIHDRYTWRGFLRSQRQNPSASVLMSVGGVTPQATRHCIKTRAARGIITQDEAERYLDYCASWAEFWRGDGGEVSNLDPSDWRQMGEGAYFRAEHATGAVE